MKKISNKMKILIVVIALVIIAGIAVIATIGFNFDIKYEETNKVELYLGKDFNIEDIRQITNETIPNQYVIIQKVEVYNDSVSIIAKEITEEQKTNLINKINEKYETELSADSTQITSIPHTRGRDILKPYIAPFAIATIIILVYMAFRYLKLGTINTILKTIGILILTQAILFSIIAITRIPIGRLTIAMVITVYMLTMIAITTRFEKKLAEKKKEENKK